MNNYALTTPYILAIIVLGILVFSMLIYCLARRDEPRMDKFDELYLKIKEDIKFSVAPKFMQLSIDVNELINLAVEVWRIEQRIAKSASDLQESQLKGLENSVQKLKRYLEKYDIEIIDYKNQKFNEGLNLDILSVEKNASIPESIVKETVEPTVMCKGQVVRKAKIILLSNN